MKECKASCIDFANIREIYDAFKSLETYNFGGSLENVTVTKENKKIVKIRFLFPNTVDTTAETRKINSFLLDRGFKSFTLVPTEENNKFVLSTMMAVIKPR